MTTAAAERSHRRPSMPRPSVPRTGTHEAQLRPALLSDLPAVERLLVASGLPLDDVRDALPTFLMAEHDGELVGVAGLEVCCDNALLRSVAVLPEWRSRGLGRELVTRVI